MYFNIHVGSHIELRRGGAFDPGCASCPMLLYEYNSLVREHHVLVKDTVQVGLGVVSWTTFTIQEYNFVFN